jgi:hypothetical protein
MKSSRLKLLLLSSVVAGACHPALGCAESNFDLASSSRLPKMLAPPDGARSGAVSARLSYHLGLWLGDGRGVTRLWLVGSAGIAVKEVICEAWEHPRSARTEGPTSYPSFSIVYCNGVIDVVEHRRMEPIFYMSDDVGLQREAIESAKRRGMIVE